MGLIDPQRFSLHCVAERAVMTARPPQAASFDTAMVRRVGTATAVEGRAKHNDHLRRRGNSTDCFGLSYFAPNINLVRDIRWGRAQETYGTTRAIYFS
jgi:beta-glucosidase